MDGLIYLDNGATSYPKPEEVYDFMFNFYKSNGVSPGRSGFDLGLETEEVVHDTRKMLTEFFNGTDPNRLTFNYNASDSLNMICDGILRKGDHVVSTNLEHNSVIRPLNHKVEEGIIEVTYVSCNEKGYINPEDIKAAIKENTKLVIVNHASNVIGTVQDVGAIGNLIKDAGVTFAVDASQSAGIVPIDMKAMNIDIIAFTGHKCLMGPTGIGGLCVAEGVEIEYSRFGGTGVRSAHPLHLREFPYRLECGTQNLIGIAGLYAGQKWLREKGIENIYKEEMKLWDKLRVNLEKIPGVKTYCAESTKNHIAVLSFNIDGFEAGDVGVMLDVDYNIACRTGLQCAPLIHTYLGTDLIHGTVRFGLGPFNTEAHIDAAIHAVKEIAAIRN
ncbi:MAG: aminotransferase class V-fold PLP-dependent enzyme [Saprospiraceae bacterium]|nr:aminotransferase class V-fold PLP-dependent enzyme [Saprospiraceae bacterium]